MERLTVAYICLLLANVGLLTLLLSRIRAWLHQPCRNCRKIDIGFIAGNQRSELTVSHVASKDDEAVFSGPPELPPGEHSLPRNRMAWATAVFAFILSGFWFAAKGNPVGALPSFPATFATFAIMLAFLWFSGFGVLEAATRWSSTRRIAASAALAVPYLLSAAAGQFQWRYFLALLVIPVALSALLALRPLPHRLTWQDVVVLAALAATLMTHSLSGAWPARGLGSLPKLYLANVALYVFIVARRLEGVGYSLVPTKKAFTTAAREWLVFAPIGIGLGLALHFIVFLPRIPTALHSFALFAGILLLTAIPEELFFRGILQNLLEPLAGRSRALLIASMFFGLSHFPKGAVFNWRYVLLATIAGFFYGRAWRANRQILASSLTHASVDTVWSLWFR